MTNEIRYDMLPGDMIHAHGASYYLVVSIDRRENRIGLLRDDGKFLQGAGLKYVEHNYIAYHVE